VFWASLYMLSDARKRRCPTCEATQLGNIAITLEPGGVCERATYAPLPPPRQKNGNRDTGPLTPTDFPLFGQSCWFEVTFRCQLGHRWKTNERLVTRGYSVHFSRSEVKSTGHYRSSEAFPSYRCPDCQVRAQQQLLRSAAVRMHQLEGVLLPARASPAPSRGASSAPPESAAIHIERLLKLGPTASARQVLGLPAGAAFDLAAAKRQFRTLALLLHPDKCDLPNAGDAFKRVLDAFASIEKDSA
jgi:hypothetical protein